MRILYVIIANYFLYLFRGSKTMFIFFFDSQNQTYILFFYSENHGFYSFFLFVGLYLIKL